MIVGAKRDSFLHTRKQRRERGIGEQTMSKYADIEQIKEVIRSEWVKYIPMDLDINLSFVLGKISEVPTIEVEDAISKHDLWRIVEDNAYWVTYNETSKEKGMTLTGINQALNECPPVVPKPKEVIYGNEHNCIMTLFGECSYSETGCGDCVVVEKVRDALAKTQSSNEDAISDMTMWADSRTSMDGSEVRLSTEEADVLWHFLYGRDIPQELEPFMNEMWDEFYDAGRGLE